ncbi:nicotinate-nucleotide--dimethylbenzimidazole phosphoribosyltransferase [Streptomyces sp. NPDC008150]|uniref:nicotinate-nucleotide--dimethylbenzimidazole phosphoribosyltransferase n=1 Tax=Streptomyces sp. NPDC008150 TaxID=3364816 RepID=UPI0036ED3E5F
MTDTGQVPGEGLPENAGMVEQPGASAHGAYTYLSESPVADEDLLLLPGAQSAWGNEVPPPAPEPVVETVHAPGPHETSGRDSGSVDLSGVRLPDQAAAAPVPPRRPLHLGPLVPDASASPVRSLADRGPAGTPVRQTAQTAQAAAGPEYLDVPHLREMSPQGAQPWGGGPVAPAQAQAPAEETVVPAPEHPVDAVAARVAVAAGTTTPGQDGLTAHASDTYGGAYGAQPPGDEAYGDDAYGVQASGDTYGGPATGDTYGGGQPAEPAAFVPQPAAGLPDGAYATDAVPAQGGHDGTWPAPDETPAADAPAGPGGPEYPGLPADQDEQPAPGTGAPHAAYPAEAQPGGPFEAARTTRFDEQGLAPRLPDDPAAPAAQDAEEFAPEPELPAAHPEAREQPAFTEEAPAGPHTLHGTAPLAPDAVRTPDAEGYPAFAGPPPVGSALDAALGATAAHGTAPADGPARQDPGAPPVADAFAPTAGQDPVGGDTADAPGAAHSDLAGAPAEPLAPVPAPRGPEHAPAPVTPGEEHATAQAQQADDLATRDAGQEESTAPVAEAAQPTGPAAPGYDDPEREAVLRVMRERRDIRNGFRGDPIPHEVLLRVLEAAHTAPSVGHSQPWDFVVIRSAETRRAMHELAMRQRDAYAQSLPKGRAKQFKEMKIEAILDTPVNVVVTADPTRGGRHTLGRHTQPQMAPYSSALAVENFWLAARAEGLGVGWVSFFDEREMVRALGLPEHLEVVAYLCVGYVDEFPEEPELMQAGWSKRRPLSWVVHEETYGRRALPGEEPHDLLGETVAAIRPLDAKALGEAWERQKRMTKPPGSLGMLEIISAQLAGLSRQCPPPVPEPAAVAIFAGDHGVHAQGVTPWPQEVTAQMVANFLGGGAVCNAFASQVGAEVCVIDVGVAADLPATPGLLPRKVRAGTSDMTTGPAMTREEARKAIEVGIETARDLVAAGNKALLTGEMGIANTTSSAALISVFTETDPAEVTGRGTGINDETLARKTEVVRRAIELHQPDPADPLGVLAALGGFEHAAMVGLLLGGASLRTPVILDGVSAGAAALVARAIAPEVLAACIAGHRSAEPGHVAALNKLGLRPLVDLDLRLGEGTGALLALPMVQSTARAMHEVATFDSAGVTEK